MCIFESTFNGLVHHKHVYMIVSKTTVVPVAECQCCLDSLSAVVCTNPKCTYTMCLVCLERMRYTIELDDSKCPACRVTGTFDKYPYVAVHSLWCKRHQNTVYCMGWYSILVFALFLSIYVVPTLPFEIIPGLLAGAAFLLVCSGLWSVRRQRLVNPRLHYSTDTLDDV